MADHQQKLHTVPQVPAGRRYKAKRHQKYLVQGQIKPVLVIAQADQ